MIRMAAEQLRNEMPVDKVRSMGILDYLDKKPRSWLLVFGLALASIVGTLDYLTGVQVSFSVFYTIPVAMMAWYIGLRYGILFSFICTFEWLFADLRETFAHPFIPYWNAIMRFVVFLLIALILSKLRDTVESERKAQQAAALVARVKSEFLANMSHEIRTPMNSVIAMSDLIVPHISTAEGKKYADILKMEGDHLLRIINDILDLSKVESGLYEFEKKNFDLHQLVDRTAAAKTVRARDRGLAFAYQIAPDVPRGLVGDQESLRRVLVNLIGNSIKFTEKGEIRLRVEKEPNGTVPGHIRFSVTDTGIGIPPEKMDAIFERFTTVDPSLTRKYGGTGLGLNISKKLVEGMGGRLFAESVPGRGSTFFFSIPFEISTEPFAKMSEPPPEEIDWALSVNNSRRPIRILHAEDIRSNRVVVEAFLKGVHQEMDDAENGEIAVQKFKSKKYDIVLMDVQMPVMDGYRATREIRQWELQTGSTPTPIIALTAHALKEEAQKSLAAGCDAHLTKPLDKAVLLKCIHDFTKSLRPPPAPPHVRMDAGLKHLIPQFLEDMRGYDREMRAALDRSDFDTIHRLGHGIKGCGGSYGFPGISECGRLIEEGAKKKDAGEIRRRLDEFSNDVQDVEIHI